MKKDQSKRVESLALLVFYGGIAAVGLLVAFVVSLVVLPSSPTARLALMVGSAALTALVIDLSLKGLLKWASKRAAKVRDGQEEAGSWPSRLIDLVYPLMAALVRVGSQGHQPR